jgi:hypothetical protein
MLSKVKKFALEFDTETFSTCQPCVSPGFLLKFNDQNYASINVTATTGVEKAGVEIVCTAAQRLTVDQLRLSA